MPHGLRSYIQNRSLGSDCCLKLDNMKVELLVLFVKNPNKNRDLETAQTACHSAKDSQVRPRRDVTFFQGRGT